MGNVLPVWTVRGVNSSECVERKDGSDVQTDVHSQAERKQLTSNAIQTKTDVPNNNANTEISA